MSVLTANHLAKAYKSHPVVKDVSLEVHSGQIVGLLGPNGAGKTTCFYMIVGIISADQGNIQLNGTDLTGLSMHDRARQGIGYLPQEASIFRKLTVADNICAILETRSDLNRQQRQDKLESLLQEFHITHIRNSLGMALSGANVGESRLPAPSRQNPRLFYWMNPSQGLIQSRWGTSSKSLTI